MVIVEGVIARSGGPNGRRSKNWEREKTKPEYPWPLPSGNQIEGAKVVVEKVS